MFFHKLINYSKWWILIMDGPKGALPPTPPPPTQMQKKKRKKKKVGKLGIKIKFRAFGPLQENISLGPSLTREDTPFKKEKRKKKKREMRETERLASINQNHHHRSLTHQPRRWPIHSNLPNFKYLKPNTNMIFL